MLQIQSGDLALDGGGFDFWCHVSKVHQQVGVEAAHCCVGSALASSDGSCDQIRGRALVVFDVNVECSVRVMLE